jgi:predicted TIM-barrel fold metal-dependent hydrolase
MVPARRDRPPSVVHEFRALPIKPAVMEQWLHGNAARILGL